VRFSRGDAGRALYVLGEVGELVASERLTIPPIQTYPLAQIAEAHRVGEAGGVHGKIVLVL
jgi:NADPH:quinone reductase-like Zn-dependent oxidoreductase